MVRSTKRSSSLFVRIIKDCILYSNVYVIALSIERAIALCIERAIQRIY
jgi:hypothetical protein